MMNIFHKVAFQGLKKGRTRTFVTIIGVALSAAMITAVATFAVSLQSYVINGAIAKYGDWHVAFTDSDASFADSQAEDGRAANVASFENIGYAALEDGINPDKPYLFIAGFDNKTFDTLPVSLITGRLPENSKEILVPAHVASNGGVRISVGDTLTLSVGTRQNKGGTLNQHDAYVPGKETLDVETERTYTVTGICQRPAFEEIAAPGYTLITKADAEASSHGFSTFVTLKNPAEVHAYAEEVAEGHDYFLNDDVLRFMGFSDDKLFNALLYAAGGILVALVMLGSVFLIYNSFHISLNERTHQFGILMSAGATEKQLRNSVLFEGFCIGAVGIPLGMLIGIPSIWLVLSLVSKNFTNILYDNVQLTLKVSIPALVAAAVISLATILISAYIPARKAAAMPVMECIRQTNEVKVEARAIKTSRFMRRVYGLEGMLAIKNFKRNKRRYRSIVLSLTLSVVLFVSAGAFRTYLGQIGERSSVEIDGDILFYTKDMKENDVLRLYDDLERADGITKSNYQALATYSCEVDKSSLTREFWDSCQETSGMDETGETADLKMDVQFIEDGIYKEFVDSLDLPAVNGSGQDGNVIVVGKKTASEDLFKSRSADLKLAAPSGGQSKTIHATFADTYPLDPPPVEPSEVKGYTFMAVVPYSMKSQFDMLSAPEKLGLTFWSDNPGKSVEQMKAIIDGTGVTAGYTLYNVHQLLEENRNILFVVNLFTAIFVIMMTLIAVANVFNTIATNIKLRRRELAMLRSVGMSDRDFNKMMRFECALYGYRTMLIGLPAAGILSWLIYVGLDAGGGQVRYTFPWSSIGASILGVFLVIFITMLYAVSKIKKENIIDALRDDII